MNEPVMNRDAALALCGGDEALFLEIARIFLEDSAALVGKLKRALESGDGDQVELFAHALKGAAGNLCAGPVHDAAETIEKASTGGDLSGAASLLQTLEGEYRRLRDHLTQLLSPGSR